VTIRKRVVHDESMRPVAVIVDYDDWLEIERLLDQRERTEAVDLSRHAGSVNLSEEPLAYQKRVRAEWD